MKRFILDKLNAFLSVLGLRNNIEEPYLPPFKPVLPDSKVVAWLLSGVEAEYMYGSREKMPGLCPACHNTVEKLPDLDYYVPRTNHFQETYDGFVIVSEKFRMFCKVQHFNNVRFIPLRSPGGFYILETDDILEVNEEYSDMPYDGEQCPVCGTYEWHGLRMIYSKNDLSDDDNFLKRPSGMFGPDWRKHYSFVVGKKTATLMKKFGLRGIYFHEVYYHA